VVTKPDQTVYPAITKREYFASAILSGFAADPQCDQDGPAHAEAAVRWADALIEALNKPRKQEATT
jgi:hypothetical protein